MFEIALFQPDIPQNTATIMRLGACLGLGVNIIEPTGFRQATAQVIGELGARSEPEIGGDTSFGHFPTRPETQSPFPP